MHKIFSFVKVYALVILFVIAWWAFAFNEKPSIGKLEVSSPSSDQMPQLSSIPEKLSYVSRERLQQALAGDTALMSQLIIEWDIDAQLMQAAGYNAQRIPQDDFLQSQRIARAVSQGSHQEQQGIIEVYHPKYIIDDAGTRICLERPFQRFLPQTFAAASILLALIQPEEIVALPRRLREQEQLYPKSLTDRISLDIDRYNSEKLFLKHPEIAFIAHYSHPSTIQALANQGVVLYTMKNLLNLSDIIQEIGCMGYIVNRPLEANLLKLFIKAAIIAIDNHLLSITTNLSQAPRILFLNYHQNFMIPTAKTLSGQLLNRLGDLDLSLKYAMDSEKVENWAIPIDKEHLLNLDPDCLIITAQNPPVLEKELCTDSAFQQLSAVRRKRISFIDEAIQSSPSQYIVLAYFDIIQALEGFR
jgi:iron complex transport system substrate-binding protein